MSRGGSALLFGGALACALAACGGGGVPADPPGASPLAHRNVMIIDEGIDLSSPDLQGKIAATFTDVCDGGASDDGGTGTGGTSDGGADGGQSFDELKSAYIARLGVPDQSCELVPGISAKDDPLPSIEHFRARWNGMVRGQKFENQVFSASEWMTITGVMNPALASFPFHGTSTASTAAHDNPHVRLVLVERRLGDPTKTLDNIVCSQQADIDQAVALLSDPDVRDAYIHAPISHYTEEFRNVVSQFDVGLVNLSYGPLSRAGLELAQQMKGCPPVDYRAYFAILHDLRVATLAANPPKPYLVVQAAGNESQTLASPADSTDCTPEDDRRLTVGSMNLVGTPSTFSNIGACVAVYAPGEAIIAPYAGGWLLVDQGTSFAAPLITRLLSLTAAEPFDPVSVRAALLAQLGPREALAFSAVPLDFFYAPAGPAATATQALTLAGAADAAARARALQDLAHADLEPVLGPLRALRALRR
jgi:hypothetical protein